MFFKTSFVLHILMCKRILDSAIRSFDHQVGYGFIMANGFGLMFFGILLSSW